MGKESLSPDVFVEFEKGIRQLQVTRHLVSTEAPSQSKPIS
jgi:hypothetical protein